MQTPPVDPESPIPRHPMGSRRSCGALRSIRGTWKNYPNGSDH
jgi:hypothetical protein